MARTLTFLLVVLLPSPAATWGPEGHALVVRAALAARPELPGWFLEAGDALAELANAPDRWRTLDESIPALAARRPDHFFDLDDWGRAPLPADRWTYVQRATRRGLHPEAVGFLPFAILEEYGVLVSAFRDARAGRAGAQAEALAAAGVLAHLAGDAAVPLHATRHHHGWVGRNPGGFTRSPGVHHWFESDLVSRVDATHLRTGSGEVQRLRDVSAAVDGALAESLSLVPRLYELERRSRVQHQDEGAVALVEERLSAGARLVARLWRTAWSRSAR
jgi:hypothetical protein